MYQKHHFEAIAFASKSTLRGLNNVAFYGDKVVATDSLRFIEIEAGGETHDPVYFDAKLLSKVKLSDSKLVIDEAGIPLKPSVDVDFPKIDTLASDYFDKTSVTEIKVNPKLLGEALIAFSKLNGSNKYPFVKISVKGAQDKNHAVTIETTEGVKARAIVMLATN